MNCHYTVQLCYRDSMLTLGLFLSVLFCVSWLGVKHQLTYLLFCVVTKFCFPIGILYWHWGFLLTVLLYIATTVPFCHRYSMLILELSVDSAVLYCHYGFYFAIAILCWHWGFLLTVLFYIATTVSTLPSGPGYADIKVFWVYCSVLSLQFFFATRVL